MKQPTKSLLLVACALCLLPFPAMAHTGIGHTTGFAAGFTHPVSGADHMLAMVAVGLWAAQMGGRAVWAVPAAFVAMMMVGGALGMSGISVPFIEQGILASVLVLGALIAGAFRFPVVLSSILVGIFAVFHGHAHGAEMPVAIGAISYSSGFALATALLHVVGIAAGVGVQKFNNGGIARVAGCAIALGGVYLTVA